MTSSLRDVTKRVCVVALLWRLVDAVYTSLNKVGGKRCCGAGSLLNVNKLSRGETICPPRRSRRIYVRARTNPQSSSGGLA